MVILCAALTVPLPCWSASVISIVSLLLRGFFAAGLCFQFKVIFPLELPFGEGHAYRVKLALNGIAYGMESAGS